jgi:hypothetical protein
LDDAGCDHAATASATTIVSSVINAPYMWLSTPGLVSDVQMWLNTPSTNFGWELINLDEIHFHSLSGFLYTRIQRCDFASAVADYL